MAIGAVGNVSVPAPTPAVSEPGTHARDEVVVNDRMATERVIDRLQMRRPEAVDYVSKMGTVEVSSLANDTATSVRAGGGAAIAAASADQAAMGGMSTRG